MNYILIADGPGFRGFFTDFNTSFWSAVLRIAEAMVAAAPFLVAGVLFAGILRGMVGANRVRRIFGVGHWSGPIRAWALGILLPICSLGALPVARELRRAGIPSGTVLSFVLVAPVLNPVSIIYGLSHIEPIMLSYFAVGTFLVSVGTGLIWNRFISQSHDIDESTEVFEQAPQSSLARIAVVGDTAARALVGPAFIDYGLALLAVGFLGAFLPHGVLQTGMTRDNAFAPIIMGLIAIPVYVTPTEVMMHFGHIVRDGYSLGAAFALIVLGAGANVGVANWLRRDYGFKPLLLFIAMLIGSTLVIGLTADRTIINGNATVADHTHAFDSFTRLSDVSSSSANIFWVFSKVSQSIRTDEVFGIIFLTFILIAGLVLKSLGDRVNMERFFERTSDSTQESTSPRWDPALSSKQIVFAGVLCMVGFAIVGLYVFYPSKDTLIQDMNMIRTSAYDAIEEKDAAETKRRLKQWKRLARKLPTSGLIRAEPTTDSQRESLEEVLYSLKTLENYVSSGRFQEANTLITYVEKVYGNCRTEFRKTAK